MLLILLAVEGYTILRIGRLLTLHVFLGMLLLGPVTPQRVTRHCGATPATYVSGLLDQYA